MRNYLNQWKYRIDKTDILMTILYGLLGAIFGGFAAGSIYYLLLKINITLTLDLFILTLLIPFLIKRGYNKYHILYPHLAILFLILGLIVTSFTYFMFLYGGIEQSFNILKDSYFWLYILERPYAYFLAFADTKDSFYLLFGIINIVIYLLSFILTYKLSIKKTYI